MSDTHGLSFNVDTSGIAKGLDAYRSAVAGIFESLKQFEAQATKTFAAVGAAANNRANLSAYAKSLQGLGNIDIDTSAARKITQLSSAVQGFRAPSGAQADNLKSFFKSLTAMPDLGSLAGTVRTIQNLSNALSGFKAPSQAQAANLSAFARSVSESLPAIERMKNISGIATAAAELGLLAAELRQVRPPSSSSITNLGNLALALRQFNSANLGGLSRVGTAINGISNFKAPTAAQVRNLENFIKAVDQLKVPTNAAAIASALNTITQSATRANSALGGLRGTLPGVSSGFSRTGSAAHGARIEMMGLQNAFSGTFQVGSVLRSLLGSLTIGELGRQFFEASQMANQFAASMEVINQSPAFQQNAWIAVSSAANQFGASLPQFAEGFAKFAVAAHESGMATGEAFKVFTGFQTVSTALHLGTEQQQSVGLAIREIMDRGYVSTQQLTRQLGLVLPGALSTLQTAWKESGKSQDNFFDALKKKEVDGKWALDQLAQHYKDTYGKAVAQALQSPIQQFNILKNNITEMMIEIGNAGAKKAFADLIGQVAGYLEPEKVKAFADAIGQGLTKGINALSNAIKFLHDNWDSIKGPLGFAVTKFGEWMAISAAFDIGKAITSPIIGLGSALPTAIRGFQQMAALTTALKGASLVGPNTAGVTAAIGKLNGPFEALFNKMQALRLFMAGGSGGLSSAFSTFATVGSAAVGVVAAAAAGLGIAFEAGETAAHDSGIRLQSDQYSSSEIIRGLWMETTDAISGWWNSATLKIGALWSDYLRPAISGFLSWLGTAVENTALIVTYVFDTLVKGIADLFVALAKSVGDTLGHIGGSANALLHGDVQGAISEGVAAATGQGFKDGFKDAFSNVQSFSEFKSSVGRGFAAAIDPVLAGAGAKARKADQDAAARQKALADAQAKAKAQREKDAIAALGPAGGASDPIYHGTDGKDGKGAEKAENQLKAFEGQWDALMQKLAGDDPVAKLQAQFTSMLGTATKLMLNNTAYNSTIGTVNSTTTSAAEKVKALEAALRSGNLNAAASRALKLSGESTDDLISKLDEAYDNLQSKIAEALEKAYQRTYKGLQNALKLASDHNPVLKVQVEASTKLSGEAKDLLSGGAISADSYKGLEPTLNGVMTGAISAKDGVNALIAALQAGAATSHLSADALSLYIDALKSQGDEETRALELAKQKATFGYDVLKNLRDEGLQYQLSAKDMDTYNKLQEAINQAQQNGITVNQQMVDTLQQQIQAYQTQNELLQKQKELHDNNGIRQWAAETEQAQDAVNGLNKDLASGLEATLEKLGTTGVLSFKSLLTTLQGDIVKYASQSITKNILNGMSGQQMFDPVTGKMSSNANPNFFGNILGQKNKPYYTADEWAGKDGGTTALKPVFDPKTGMMTQLGQGAIPTAAQPLATALKAANKYDGAGNLLVAQGASSQTDPNGPGAPLQAVWDKAAGALRVSVTNQPQGGAAGTGTGTNLLGGGSTNPLSSILPSSLQEDPLNIVKTGANGFDSTGLNADGTQMAVSQITGLGLPSIASSGSSSGGLLGGLFGKGGLLGGLGGLFTQTGPTGMAGLQSYLGGLFGGGSSGGGLLGGLGGLFKGLFSGSGGLLGGGGLLSMFGLREGGVMGSLPRSFTSGLPAFAEGTPHTGNFSGGMPAVLHQNEAVIPLSRGRSVPVEFAGNGPMAQSQPQGQHITFNVTSPNPDSFRRSQSQMATQAYAVGAKAARRNMG